MRTPPHGRTATTRLRVLGLALVTLGALAGCGQESVTATYPEATAGSIPDDETTTTTGRSTTSTRPGTTTRGGSTTSTARATTTTKAPNPAFADYCRTYVALLTSVVDRTSTGLEAQKKVFRDLAAAAPAPIKADLDAYSAYAQTVTSADQMRTSNLPPELKAADQRLEDWHEENCGH